MTLQAPKPEKRNLIPWEVVWHGQLWMVDVCRWSLASCRNYLNNYETSRIFQVPDVLTFPKTDFHYSLAADVICAQRLAARVPQCVGSYCRVRRSGSLLLKVEPLRQGTGAMLSCIECQSETHWISRDNLKLSWHVMAALLLTLPTP